MVSKDSIQAIVFDFGNVIINIDLEKTFEAFSELTFKPASQIKRIFSDNELFRKYESGFYSDEEFRDVVRQTLSFPLNDNEIDDAWNALLLDVPKKRWDFLEKIKYKYPIYLLSNTNNIHIEKCVKNFRNAFGVSDFRKEFSKAYLSYELGLWKPDYKIYQHVFDDLKLNPNEMLFIDDNADNIEAATDLGINCVKINPPECFTEILEHIL